MNGDQMYNLFSMVISTIFFYGVLRSPLHLKSKTFSFYFAFGAASLQWGISFLVIHNKLAFTVTPLLLGKMGLLFLLTFLIYLYGFSRLRNIEDQAVKSYQYITFSVLVGIAAIGIQVVCFGNVLGLYAQLNELFLTGGFLFTMLTFFLIFRIIQQLKLDDDFKIIKLSKFSTFVLSLTIANTVVGCVILVIDTFSIFTDKTYLAMVFFSTLLLIFFTVIYGETQYDQKNERLKMLAYHDPLTGLYNRIFLQKELERLVQRKDPFHLMFIDLDHFKQINDLYGHHMGDLVLSVLAERLTTLDGYLHVTRLGGDEFTILTEIPDSELDTFCKKLIEKISIPISGETVEIQVTTSIGVATYPKDGEEAEQLMQRADLAMYKAKSLGRNRASRFDYLLETTIREQLMLKSDLAKGLTDGEFFLHYQPLINMKQDRIQGFEALIRWSHPDKGVIYPNEFIPVAEDTGLIIPIGEWVLNEACKQVVKWNREFGENFTISVNLSLKQFNKDGLFDHVSSILTNTGLAAELLTLEITESTIMEDPELTMETLGKLVELGVVISIDDFGTGYSSLACLKQFKVQNLKIDRNFIKDVTHNPEDRVIVDAIMSMATKLGIEVVAEGVEKVEQKHLLEHLDCTYAQGYLFTEPTNQDVMTQFIANFEKVNVGAQDKHLV